MGLLLCLVNVPPMQVCLRPLQRMFACAIPSERALQAIVALNLPLLEVGAGSGYWARLLRARGVDVLAFDLHPPSRSGEAEERNQEGEVRKRLFCAIFYQNPKNYQDRLGTDIGKTQKRHVFLTGGGGAGGAR
jgi:hypothetical protein